MGGGEQQQIRRTFHCLQSRADAHALSAVFLAGSCGYEIHDDHLEWPNVKQQWDELSQRRKDRWVMLVAGYTSGLQLLHSQL